MLLTKLATWNIRKLLKKAVKERERAAACAAMDGETLAAEVLNAEKNSVVPFPFRNIGKRPLSSEHEIDCVHDEGLAGIGRAIKYIHPRPEFERRHWLLGACEREMPDTYSLGHAPAPQLRSRSWNSATHLSKISWTVSLIVSCGRSWK